VNKLYAARERLELALNRLEQVQERHLKDLAAFQAEHGRPAAAELTSALEQLQSTQKEKLRLEALHERVGGRLDALIERLAALTAQAEPAGAPDATDDRDR
jgi:chromosome segregation ATPase